MLRICPEAAYRQQICVICLIWYYSDLLQSNNIIFIISDSCVWRRPCRCQRRFLNCVVFSFIEKNTRTAIATIVTHIDRKKEKRDSTVVEWIAWDGDVFHVSAIVYAPRIVTTLADGTLVTNARDFVQPDWSVAETKLVSQHHASIPLATSFFYSFPPLMRICP